MTAEVRVVKEREGNGMRGQDKNQDEVSVPMEPDESWWAAVLADEPLIDDQVHPVEPKPNIEPPPHLQPESQPASTSSVNWLKVQQIFTSDAIITMNVVGHNRGGVLVSGKDIHGFVPASHLIDVPADISEDEREQYLTSYLDRKISLKVIECDPDKERVVFSERAALAGEGQRRHLLSSLSQGDVVEGDVTNVTSFGVFVDLGGLEGLIHVSELSWGRVQHPSDILKIGDRVTTVILQVLEDEGRIALSLKRLDKNPWDEISVKLSPGDVVDAEITNITKFGAFARLTEGIEGLIHISSMNFPDDCTQIEEFLFEGQDVQVCVLSLDCKKRRLGLKLEKY